MSGAQIAIICLIFVLTVGIGIFFVRAREAERQKRVLQVIQGRHGNKRGGPQLEKDEQDKRRAQIAQKLKDNRSGEAKKKGKATTSMLLAQAGIKASVKKFWIASVVSMVICVVLAKVMHASPIVMLFAAIIGLLGLPRFIVKRKAAKRQKKFLEEFPDALEAVVRLLKAGMPVAEAVSMIAREFDGPIGEEMSIIYDKQKIGIPLHEAAQEATRRMPLTEMNMFATGLAIQAQTGSSLSEVLMNLSRVIRARFRLKRKVKALASEAVASASIIGALPILVATGMWFTNREYISILFTDPTGKLWAGFAVVWMLTGIFVMKQMINFKV